MNTSDPSDQALKVYSIPLEGDITSEHIEYLKSHPELKTLLSGYLFSLLDKKPTKILPYTQDYFANQKELKPLYRPLVISGPSGVGKGTLIKMLLQRYPGLFELSVSYTTRKPRQGEEHGTHYFFVTPEDFSSEIPKGSYIEYTEVHGNFYGTHRDYVRKVMERNKICLLEIDVVGAQKVSQSGQDCHYVFIEPPSIEELKSRLSGRGTEKQEVINLRMTNAVVEIQMAKNFGIYEKTLINDTIEDTFKQLVGFINDKYPGINLNV